MVNSTGRRWTARIGVVGAAVAAVTAALVVPAWAHVKVSGIDATQGGYGVVTFRVPSESDTASTTELLITFPSDTPFTSADTQPKAGWTATVAHKPLATPLKDDDGNPITQYVSQVDIKATSPAAGIPPGQFDLFNLSVGQFPKVSSVSFAALQTYSDGTTVNWNEKAATGAAEPEHPAPVLQLAAAVPDDMAASASSASAAPAAPAAPPAVSAASAAPASGSSWTGVTGLVLGVIALLVSVAAFVGSRRRAPTSAGG